jgi:ABC-type uncharacterized transport system substrate-binding protein
MISTLAFEFNNTDCKGFWVEWKFDDFFSSSIINDYDKNHDKFFDANEQKIIYKRAFINLKNYGYFVFIRKGNARKNPARVEKFSVWQKNGQLFYKFFVPLEGADYRDNFHVAIFDRSYYCNILYSNPAAVINQRMGEKPRFDLKINKKFPVYYNPLGAADDSTVYKKWKPGLETAYPDEIHIFFQQ